MELLKEIGTHPVFKSYVKEEKERTFLSGLEDFCKEHNLEASFLLHHYKKEDEYAIDLKIKGKDTNAEKVLTDKVHFEDGYWVFQSSVEEDIEDAFEDLMSEVNNSFMGSGILKFHIPEEISKKELKSLFPNM